MARPKRDPTARVNVQVRLDHDLARELAALAQAERRSLANLATVALASYLAARRPLPNQPVRL